LEIISKIFNNFSNGSSTENTNSSIIMSSSLLNNDYTVVIKNSTMKYLACSACSGAAVSISNIAYVTLENSTISNNKCSHHGGGIFISDSSLILSQALVN